MGEGPDHHLTLLEGEPPFSPLDHPPSRDIVRGSTSTHLVRGWNDQRKVGYRLRTGGSNLEVDFGLEVVLPLKEVNHPIPNQNMDDDRPKEHIRIL